MRSAPRIHDFSLSSSSNTNPPQQALAITMSVSSHEARPDFVLSYRTYGPSFNTVSTILFYAWGQRSLSPSSPTHRPTRGIMNFKLQRAHVLEYLVELVSDA